MMHHFVWKKHDPKMQVPKKKLSADLWHFIYGTYIFASFLYTNLLDQYGALNLHNVLLLLPVGSSRVCIDGPRIVHGWLGLSSCGSVIHRLPTTQGMEGHEERTLNAYCLLILLLTLCLL